MSKALKPPTDEQRFSGRKLWRLPPLPSVSMKGATGEVVVGMEGQALERSELRAAKTYPRTSTSSIPLWQGKGAHS